MLKLLPGALLLVLTTQNLSTAIQYQNLPTLPASQLHYNSSMEIPLEGWQLQSLKVLLGITGHTPHNCSCSDNNTSVTDCNPASRRYFTQKYLLLLLHFGFPEGIHIEHNS